MNDQEQTEYFNVQQAYLNSNIEQIIPIYGGRFVGVYNKMIIDSDIDEFELIKRFHLRSKFDITLLPTVVTKIPKTLEEHIEQVKRGPEVWELESPEGPEA